MKQMLLILILTIPAYGETPPKRLALLVGIDSYAAPRIPQLQGAVNDVRRLAMILKELYGYRENEITTLLNEQATLAGFQDAWHDLVKRADGQTQVVVFFAGHGSRVADRSHDETDGFDETLVFHDSRTGEVTDLVDDKFNGMLHELSQKQARVTLILDAGSAAGTGKGESRWLGEDDKRKRRKRTSPKDGRDWDPKSFTRLTFLGAAKEGTAASEIIHQGRHQGAFSAALCDLLARGEVRTYDSLFLSMAPLMGYQSPVLQGDGHAYVFSHKQALRPLAWKVWETEPLILGGPVLPHMGKGAELIIYDPVQYSQSQGDPKMAKTLVSVVESEDVRAQARLIGKAKSPLRKGDLAVPSRPSDDSLSLKVQLVRSGAGAIPGNRAFAIRKQARNHPMGKHLIRFDEPGPSKKIIHNSMGQLELLDEQDRQLLVYDTALEDEPYKVVNNLLLHARKLALLSLQGQVGHELRDNHSLQVRVVRAGLKPIECTPLTWLPGPPNRVQKMPYCLDWRVEVTVHEDVEEALLVGGVYMDGSGTMVGFPKDGGYIKLKAGQTHVFDSRTFRSTRATGIADDLIVFGTTVDQPINWNLLTQLADVRTSGETTSALARTLNRYLLPTSRGADVGMEEAGVWTKTHLAILVE